LATGLREASETDVISIMLTIAPPRKA